jgi:pyruvate formate lyase activating enzyme
VGANSLASGHSAIDRRKCEGCGDCVERCPNGARTLTGRDVTVDEVVQEVLRDKKFYDNSGGGVTLSGGDPLDQPEFALSILKACKKADIHTAIETCGYAPWPSMEKLLEYIDLLLYDIKCIEPGKHRKATGKSNERILENAKRLARSKSIKVRVPLIPDFNDSPEDVKAIVNFVNKEMGHVETELLPYNKLGESKYERLDRSIVELQAKDEGHRESLEKLTKIYPV